MLRLFIGSHGRFASGLLGAVEVLLGSQRAVTTYDAYLDDTTVADAVDAFYATVQAADQVVLMSDLYGGSVNTALCAYLDRPNTTLVSGVNLAFVLAIALEPAPVADQRIRELVEQSRDQLRVVLLDEAPVDAGQDFFDE
ncbi:MAG: hypothetical protein QM779_15560 [Propionicimonas sp.]|uniref:PTS sugar transporter subunit IIA n=1 Tax=Propionicimonas sp. TaxID=1955623 RepID=UPI003D0A3212